MKKPIARTNRPETLSKLSREFHETLAHIWGMGKNPEDILNNSIIDSWHVTVSDGNSKIGNCGNVSTPPVVTCSGCCADCAPYCYAVRAYNRMGNGEKLINNPWFRNAVIYMTDPGRYFKEIDTAIKANYYQFFRWHVSGEIASHEYFRHMVEIAENNPSVRFLAFTKRYEIVNLWIETYGDLPKNFKVLFSKAPNMDMPNPFKLPETHVNFADASKNTCHFPEAQIYHCPGNCAKCRFCGAGCWFMENGSAVVFDQH